jgi:predicted nucleic acid-binding protein
MLDRHQLMGRGIGYGDAHLVVAALIDEVRLWTCEKRLAAVVRQLGLG